MTAAESPFNGIIERKIEWIIGGDATWIALIGRLRAHSELEAAPQKLEENISKKYLATFPRIKGWAHPSHEPVHFCIEMSGEPYT